MQASGGFSFGTGSGNNKDGSDISAANAILQASYTTLGWKFGTNNDNPWTMGTGDYKLPVFWWQTEVLGLMPF